MELLRFPLPDRNNAKSLYRRVSKISYLRLFIFHFIPSRPRDILSSSLALTRTPQLSSRLKHRLPPLYQHRFRLDDNEFQPVGPDAARASRHGHRDGTVQQR